MKIAIVSQTCDTGGAARSAKRLHYALLESGVDSTLFFISGQKASMSAVGPSTNIEKFFGLIRPTLDKIPTYIYPKRQNKIFSTNYISNKELVRSVNQIKADLINVHWVGSGVLSISDWCKLNAPLVFTLHDNWLFTGGCHVNLDCNKYLTSCNKCPQLGSKMQADLSSFNFNRKKRFFQNNNSHIISPSKWLSMRAKSSQILQKAHHHIIPNAIDRSLFYKVDKKLSREYLGLDVSKKYILFGAISASSDLNKGYDLLIDILQRTDKEYELIVFGAFDGIELTDRRIHFLGTVNDEFTLKFIYNAADITIVPSRQENYSNVILESLYCSTPVACFDVGGNSELVEHGRNGYVISPFDTEKFAFHIDKFFACDPEYMYEAEYNKLANNYDVVSKKYLSVFDLAVNDGKH